MGAHHVLDGKQRLVLLGHLDHLQAQADASEDEAAAVVSRLHGCGELRALAHIDAVDELLQLAAECRQNADDAQLRGVVGGDGLLHVDVESGDLGVVQARDREVGID